METPTKIKIKWPYKPYPKQKDAIFGPQRFSYIEGSTKSGKSSFARVWILQETLTHKKQSAFISPVFRQAKDMFTHMCTVVEQFPKGMVTINKTDLLITFSQGGSIQFFTGDAPNSLYGYGFHSVVIDEASRVKQETYDSILSTISATNGRLRAIGNVYGRSNWFYKECRKAEAGLLKDSTYHKLTAQDVIDAGIRPKDYLDQFRERYSPAMFRELFFCEPSGNNASPFGSDNIKAIEGAMSSASVFCWGIDVAQSQDSGDATCLIGLDKNGKVCRFIHVRLNGPEVIKLILDTIKPTQIAYLDGTAIGKMVYDSICGQKPTNKWTSYTFTSTSKPILMETLTAGIISHDITIPKDSLISQELDDFEYGWDNGRITYSAPAGLHDDCVIALALAYKAFVDNRSKTYTPSVTYTSERDLGVNGDIW